MLPTKFRFIWTSGFRGEDFKKSAYQKQELTVAAMLVPSQMLPTKFQFIWESGFRGEDFLDINQSETSIAYGGHVCLRIKTK